MTFEEAGIIIGNIPIPLVILGTHDKCYSLTEYQNAKVMAIKSLEAWEKIKDQLRELVHHNLDVKENFEIGSTSRIECNTTASVLEGVIYLIDKHLSEVSE